MAHSCKSNPVDSSLVHSCKSNLLMEVCGLQLKEHCAASCFQLIGRVMPKVAWTEVIAAFKARQDPQVARRLQAAILLLLVQCYGDVNVREVCVYVCVCVCVYVCV